MDNSGVSSAPQASIVIPSRGRPQYLDVALGSVSPQAERAEAEVLVVSDGPDPQTASVARQHGAKLVSLVSPRGLNAARNAGVQAAAADLIVFLDDDVYVPPGWLDALLAGVAAAPDREVYGGPIRAKLEGGGPRACGREPAPITTLDHGHRRSRRRRTCGVRTWPSSAARSRASAPLTRRSRAVATRRNGSADTPARAVASATSRVPGSSTAGLVRTRPSARFRGRRTTWGSQRGATTCARAVRPASQVSSACSSAACGTPAGAVVPTAS